MKDTKTFTHKGARRKITIMLGLQKSCLLNKVIIPLQQVKRG